MPRRDLNRFPPQFMELAATLEKDDGEILIETDTPKALRMELYSFRSALRKSEKVKEFPAFDDAEILVDENGRRVVIKPKEKKASALAIGKALAGRQGSMDGKE